jgi:hypothetical protein
MAQGGMATVHSSMGSASIYGNEVDLLIYDGGTLDCDFLTLLECSNFYCHGLIGKTERQNPEKVDLFYRQGLIGGNRVPVLWGGLFPLLRLLHQEADADVGEFGMGLDGILQVTSAEQAKTIPWAARYLNCSKESENICRDEPRFCAICWIERNDGVTPIANQTITGQVEWHPGWRMHQLVGRVLAFSILDALQSAIVLWGERTMSMCLRNADFSGLPVMLTLLVLP